MLTRAYEEQEYQLININAFPPLILKTPKKTNNNKGVFFGRRVFVCQSKQKMFYLVET